MTEILIALISSAFTLFATKYATSYSKKNSILEKQLYNIYLPLIKHVRLNPINFQDNNNKQLFNPFFNELNEIVNNHYELVNPKFIELFDTLSSNLDYADFSSCKHSYDNLIKYINYNYNVIKMKLHLPNNSWISNYVRSQSSIYTDRISIAAIFLFIIFSFKTSIIDSYFFFKIPKNPDIRGLRDTIDIGYKVLIFILITYAIYNLILCLLSFVKRRYEQ